MRQRSQFSVPPLTALAISFSSFGMSKRTPRAENAQRGEALQALALELLVLSGKLRRNRLKIDIARIEIEAKISQLRTIGATNASA